MEVLFEDSHIICINKPPGVSVQRDTTGGVSLEEMAGKNSGIVHRIDKPVSGVVVFAKSKKALEIMNRDIRERRWKKRYWAIITGEPRDREGELVHYLKKNSRLNKSYIREDSSGGGKEARLAYRVIGSSDRYWFVAVELMTGRHHQIRSQLAHIGCPIKGDLKYGSKRSNRGGGINLHARSILLNHPVTGEKLELTADPPDDTLWHLFSHTIAGVP